MTLEWIHPFNFIHTVKHYNLCYTSESWGEVGMVHINSTITMVTLHNLEEATLYAIQLSAVNRAGPGDPATVQGKTLSDGEASGFMHVCRLAYCHVVHMCVRCFHTNFYLLPHSLSSPFRHTKEPHRAGDVLYKCHLDLGCATICGTKWLPHWILSELLHQCRPLAYNEEGQ